ncbi:hypothetical protein BS639_15275 [Rouxiella silvae]|uniref:Type III secretion system inner rod subunit SctI n=1 Tax=Rouxiella silvae TaxID=1646373 RepID=A0AA40X2X3_9GAMM|nr:type III secretion system inner rod subunit SctI [Rouxiella silvae]MBF6637701.1 type III secretion system inner rod subunit SctI [Rouxiella silvae]ORJ20332.1 hypothetical protein BS639_15275 [Rouxiella silvae]
MLVPQALGSLNARRGDINNLDNTQLTLDQQLISVYANNAEKFNAQKQHVLGQLSSVNSPSSPEQLFSIQQQTADYNIEVSLISALTRKATSAVETLLRA